MIKFGTDGWRAVIGEDFTFENIKIVSQAVADYLKKKGKKQLKVVIGYDQRFLSKEFAFTSGVVLGCNGIAVDISSCPIPTPVVSFNCRYNNYDLGIMITASHNPAQFNGFKIKTPEGGGADKVLTDEVEKFLYKSKYKFSDTFPENVRVKDITAGYAGFLRKFVDVGRIRKLKLKVLVDTMYGSGDHFIERTLGKSSIKIDYLHNEFNPSFGGIHPEPVEENLQELISNVRKYKYDIGVALDGDADRIAVVNRQGEFINAQVLLPLLAIHMIKNRKKKKGIGKTVVGSNLIDEVSLSLNVSCYETPVGFKYLSNLFKEDLISIGGEEAGGIGFEGYIPERDGSVSFLMLLEMLVCENTSFEKLINRIYKDYGRWYYARTAIPLKNFKTSFRNLKISSRLLGKKVDRINDLDGIKIITSEHWLMFRKSGTEPIVRIYAEARSKENVKKLINIGKKMVYGI